MKREDIELLNGVGPFDPDEYLQESYLYPWKIDSGGHEGYLIPESATPAHLPRVLDPAVGDLLLAGDWSLSAREAVTCWVGDGAGVVSRAPNGEPIVRALTFVCVGGDRRQAVWAIADGYLDGGHMVPCRVTTALDKSFAMGDYLDNRASAQRVLNSPWNYFLGDEGPRKQGLFEADTADSDIARDIFANADALMRIADPARRPEALRRALSPFSEDRRALPDREREGRPLSDENYAALSLAFIVSRALRERAADGTMGKPNEAFGDEIGKSGIAVRGYLKCAKESGVITEATPGTGARYLTPRGQDLASRLVRI